MGQRATFGFPEGKRPWPVLRRFRMGKLVHAHLRPPHPRPFAVPRPQRQGRCALQPGVTPSAALPRVWGRRSHQPQGGCAEGSNGWHPPSLLAFVRPRSQFSPLPSTDGANYTSLGYRPRKLGVETIQGLKARYHPVGRDMAGLQPFGFIIMAETQAVGLGWHSPGRWPSETTRPVIHAVTEPMGSGPPFLCARCGPHFTKSEPLRQQMARGILPAHPDTDVRSSPSLHPAWDVALKGQSVWQSS